MRDRIVASEAGALAVEALIAGRSGMMIGRQGGQSVEVPLADVVSRQHPPANLTLLSLAQSSQPDPKVERPAMLQDRPWEESHDADRR